MKNQNDGNASGSTRLYSRRQFKYRNTVHHRFANTLYFLSVHKMAYIQWPIWVNLHGIIMNIRKELL